VAGALHCLLFVLCILVQLEALLEVLILLCVDLNIALLYENNVSEVLVQRHGFRVYRGDVRILAADNLPELVNLCHLEH